VTRRSDDAGTNADASPQRGVGLARPREDSGAMVVRSSAWSPESDRGEERAGKGRKGSPCKSQNPLFVGGSSGDNRKAKLRRVDSRSSTVRKREVDGQ